MASKVKKARARTQAKYQASEKGKAAAARYAKSDKRKIVQARANAKRFLPMRKDNVKKEQEAARAGLFSN